MFECKEIKEKIQEFTGVEDIGIKSNKREFSDLKKIYCKLCKQLTISSLAIIANTLRPNYNHASVLHNVRKFEDLGKQLTCFDIYLKVFNHFKLVEDFQKSIKAKAQSDLNNKTNNHE